MNYKKAFEILEIDLSNVRYNDVSLDYLKKQYRRLALKNHPDKNGNTPESNEMFKQINEAYHYLKIEMNYLNPEEQKECCHSSLYLDILNNFMKTVFEGSYTDTLSAIVNDIITNGKKISVKLFDGLDKDTTLHIYTFLSNNRHILHLTQENLDVIRNIVVKNYDNVEVYKLNPSINDILNNNVYKLFINNELFLVPLWLNESYFDGSGCEIIVICEPELPDGIKIDENNNICIDTTIQADCDLHNMIINNCSIPVNVGDKIFEIPFSQLYMKKEQYYRIKNEGVSKVKKDIYDVVEKTDIIVNIILAK